MLLIKLNDINRFVTSYLQNLHAVLYNLSIANSAQFRACIAF